VDTLEAVVVDPHFARTSDRRHPRQRAACSSHIGGRTVWAYGSSI